MITVTIEGKEIQTEPHKTIIEAAFENGIYIPHFCWHPDLAVSGNCRMCLVEVENMPKQVIACMTRCTDGMVVSVNSEKAIDAREAVMEFILINHPLDCPICDEAGECKLQDYTYKYSIGESRFDEEKNLKRKRVELGPEVMFDAERCISCSRCIRFCEEKVGDPQLTFVERGDRVTIETFPGKKLDNPYSMNVIDICPVGALTSTQFRFKARVWDMASTENVCPGCARGCSMNIWTRQNEILRLTPRENQYVNDFWMCDNGRLNSFKHTKENRVKEPSIKRDGVHTEVTWDEAIATVVGELKHYTKGQVAIIGSPYDMTEDAYALRKFADEVVQTPYLGIIEHRVEGDDDDFLIRSDKTPNMLGAKLAGVPSTDARYGLPGIIDALKDGSIRVLIVTDRNAFDNKELVEAIGDTVYVIAIVSNTSELTERAEVVLASATFAEKLGTFVNEQGHMQLLRPAVVTSENQRWMGGYSVSRLDKFGSEFDRWGQIYRHDCRATWKIVAGIARVMGVDWGYLHPEDIFEEMSEKVDELKGLTYEALGRRGVTIIGDPKEWLVPYAYEDVTQKSVLRTARV